MTTQVLTSFAELAKVLKGKTNDTYNANVKARKLIADSPFRTVETVCGRKAAIIWAWMQEQESCKRYGDAGTILNSPAKIASITGYPVEKVEDALIRLITNGYAKYNNGLARAA